MQWDKLLRSDLPAIRLREREISVLEDRITQLRAELGDRRPQREAFVADRLEKIKRGAQERHPRNEPGPGAAK